MFYLSAHDLSRLVRLVRRPLLNMVYQVLDRLRTAAHTTDDEEVLNALLVLVLLAVLAELEVMTVVGEAVVTHVGFVVRRTSTLVLFVIKNARVVQDILKICL